MSTVGAWYFLQDRFGEARKRSAYWGESRPGKLVTGEHEDRPGAELVLVLEAVHENIPAEDAIGIGGHGDDRK